MAELDRDNIIRFSVLYRDSIPKYPYHRKNHPRNTMKVFAVVLLFAIVAYASAVVIPEMEYDGMIELGDGKIINLQDVDTDGGLPTGMEVTPIRHRRVTCDLLSFTTPWGGLNHAACAARCLVQRHKGGACNGGVCHCRN